MVLAFLIITRADQFKIVAQAIGNLYVGAVQVLQGTSK